MQDLDLHGFLFLNSPDPYLSDEYALSVERLADKGLAVLSSSPVSTRWTVLLFIATTWSIFRSWER